VETLLTRPYGMVLVTGPTGSGKTTTLYGMLNKINSMDKNIITIEDPVEYQMPIIRQTQVNAKAGLTFATGLRNILRQDPDVILVGEIRDAETVTVAIEAALTGHLVFSTIHTNDAAGAITRLLDMQIEPFLICSSLVGVLGQRLVRTVCEKCRESYTVDPEVIRKLGVKTEQTKFFRGKGCSACKRTGYTRRVGVFELLVIDEDIRRLMLAKASNKEIKAAALKKGMISMRMDGLRKAEQGVTTIEEVLKATMEEEE
jgi:type II secretory ATPase GspE/PulE/Tfp pilus assembly ATPase PilB-like protein